MSLSIDVDKVIGVLLADGWHEVGGDSFTLDAYEYLSGDQLVHGGGQSGVCVTGFEFTDIGGYVIAGPLTAIHAVRRRR